MTEIARMQDTSENKRKSPKTTATSKDNTTSKKSSGSSKKSDSSNRTATKAKSGRTSAQNKKAQENTNKAASSQAKANVKVPIKVNASLPRTRSRASSSEMTTGYDYLIAALLIILSAVIFLMIFTFSEQDLAKETEETLNLFGIVGAYIGNIMLKLFGLTSFCFPAVCLFKGITTFCGKPLDVKPSELIGLVLLLLVASPLFEVCMTGATVLDHSPGGALGSALSHLALNYLSPSILGISGTILTLLAVLLVTDTSLKSFIKSIYNLVRGLFAFIGKSIVIPFKALREYQIERANRIPPIPDDIPDPLADPTFEESTDELLGHSEPSSDYPATTSENSMVSSEEETSLEDLPIPPPSPQIPDEQLRDNIVSRLDDEEEEFSEEFPMHHDDEPEEDSPLSLLANLNTKLKNPQPRSAKRSSSVPTLEPDFNFTSIELPEDLAKSNNEPAESNPPVQETASKALGAWKPRALRPASSQEPAASLQKSFAPETGLETLALSPNPDPGLRPIRNITNNILDKCNEEMPSSQSLNQLLNAKPAPEANKTGCVSNASLEGLISASKATPSPRDITAQPNDDISAFFKNSDNPIAHAPTDPANNAKIALLNGLSDFKPSANNRFAKARDIMATTKPAMEQSTTSDKSARDLESRRPVEHEKPTKNFDIRNLMEREKPTQNFDVKDLVEREKPTQNFEIAQAAQSTTRVADQQNYKTPVRNDSPTAAGTLEIESDLDFDSLPAIPAVKCAPSPNQPSIHDLMNGFDDDDDDDIELNSPVNASSPQRNLEVPAAESSARQATSPRANKQVSPPTPANACNFSVDSGYQKVSEASIEKADRERRSHEDRRATYQKPPLSLLSYDPTTHKGYDQNELQVIATRIEDKLAEFNILGEIVHICQGPVVTRFEFKPNAGTKVSKIPELSNDLMMALEIISIRILAPIPGKPVVGIEIPNDYRNTIYLKEVLASDEFMHNKSPLTVALGKDTEGKTVVSNLAKMPHLLVAGTTGSGKSVSINTMICSILYNATPDEVRMILVDPKCLEFTIYAGIPHLLTPPITTAKETQAALDWACEEMERRYRLLSDIGVRNIIGYNDSIAHPSTQRVRDELNQTNDDGSPKHVHLPYIVIIVDEFADLMMVARKEIETQIARLAQKARAAGIHIILATQRPSTNVITGIIKANFPSRLALKVGAIVDSRTILDHMGAEKLLGRGDGLFRGPDSDTDQRVHGCFVSDEEVQSIVDFLCAQGEPEYNNAVLAAAQEPETVDDDDDYGSNAKKFITDDPIYQQAIELVRLTRKASTSLLQRELGIGYPKASKVISQMEKDGLIGPADSKHNREIYI